VNINISRIFLAVVVSCVLASQARAYVYSGSTSVWLPGSIPFQVKLGSATTLQDGTNHSTSVQQAMLTWNSQLGTVQFVPTIVAQSDTTDADHEINEIVFHNKVEGEDFGEGVLAITVSYSYPSIHQQTTSDIFFNTAYTWDSYRGNLLQSPEDIRRVALHELGHALGLSHPDDHGQSVTAIMNSTAGDLDTLASDDIAGAQSLYRAPGDTNVASNNDFANASFITLINNTAQVSVSSVYTTKQTGEPNHAGYNGGGSVWWKWTAPGNGSMAVTTQGSYFDTLLAVYTGTAVSTLTAIASNDQATESVSYSALSFNVAAGTKYYFAVDGWAGESGFVSLGLTFSPEISNSAPIITGQPSSQTIVVGQSVDFSVVANGVPDPTYQWRKNGVNLPGATGRIYSIPSVVLGDAGSYTVVVSNIAGAVLSVAAQLSVTRGVAADLNSDGQSDLFWTNTDTGERRVWLMDGSGNGEEVSLGLVSVEWEQVGTADFNQDGHADVYWQNRNNGERAVWLMNGTSLAGYQTITTVDPEWNIGAVGDFNQDGHPDLLWEHTLTGERGIWLLNAGNLIGYAPLGTIGIQWTAAGLGDFNQDGWEDIVWQNSLTGERKVWLMEGAEKSSEVSFGFVALEWVMGGVGDYTGDGQPDVYWQSTRTGERAIWIMQGTTVAGYAFPTGTSTTWVAGRIPRRPAVPDFNLDGKPDLVWQNTSTGERKLWLMNGTGKDTEVSLGTETNAWQIAVAGDLDNDGRSDLIWQNTATGERRVWLMNGTTVTSTVSLGTVATSWQIVGTADFTGDNRTDILWQNTATGERGIWLMFGTTVSGYIPLGVVSDQWQIVAAADFNRDDQPDILWQNTATGERKVWYMNGTSFASEAGMGTVALNWSMVGAGDYNLDGFTDVLWQNTATGERGVWLLNELSLAGYVDLGTQTTTWQIAN